MNKEKSMKVGYGVYAAGCLAFWAISLIFQFSPLPILLGIVIATLVYFYIANNGATTGMQARTNYHKNQHNTYEDDKKFPRYFSFKMLLIILLPPSLLSFVYCIIK